MNKHDPGLPPDLVFQPDGHLADACLACVADGEIAELHGGRVDFEPADPGLRVRLSLPQREHIEFELPLGSLATPMLERMFTQRHVRLANDLRRHILDAHAFEGSTRPLKIAMTGASGLLGTVSARPGLAHPRALVLDVRSPIMAWELASENHGSAAIVPRGSVTGKPAPIAAAIGSSIRNTRRAPADKADS